MIYVIDLLSVSEAHVVYNAAIIEVLSLSYPDKNIHFYAEKNHQEFVKDKLSSDLINKIVFKNIHLNFERNLSVRKIYLVVKNILYGIFMTVMVHRKALRDKDNLIFLCSAPTISILIFLIINKMFTSVKSIITLHGEVDYIYNSSGLRDKLIGRLYKFLFKLKSYNLKYLLLNKISKSILINDGHLDSNMILDINHPYKFNTSTNGYDIKNIDIPLIGHIGSMCIRKDSHKLYEMAFNLKHIIEEDKIRITIIGFIEESVLPYVNNLVKSSTLDVQTSYISRSAFETAIEEIDYSIFLFDKNQYLFRASGSVLDAIEFEKPIICLNHPYFNYLFEQAGDIGFICNTYDDIVILLEKIAYKDLTLLNRYLVQVENIKKLKDIFNLTTVVEDFKSQYLI